MTGHMVRLTSANRSTVHAIRDRAEVWLASKGLEQYNGANAAKARCGIDAELDAGLMVGWSVGDSLVAVAAIKEADPDFWTPEEVADPEAVWLARFMVACSGRGYGLALLDAIVRQEGGEGHQKNPAGLLADEHRSARLLPTAWIPVHARVQMFDVVHRLHAVRHAL